MADFEKPSAAANEDTYEDIPSPEEITALEAETNELAQEATELTSELNAVIKDPETTEEQLGFIERKVSELKELWDNLEQGKFLVETGLATLGVGAVARFYNIASGASGPILPYDSEASYIAATLAAIIVAPLIASLHLHIKDAKKRIEDKKEKRA